LNPALTGPGGLAYCRKVGRKNIEGKKHLSTHSGKREDFSGRRKTSIFLIHSIKKAHQDCEKTYTAKKTRWLEFLGMGREGDRLFLHELWRSTSRSRSWQKGVEGLRRVVLTKLGI